jgi:hypothetical protein
VSVIVTNALKSHFDSRLIFHKILKSITCMLTNVNVHSFTHNNFDNFECFACMFLFSKYESDEKFLGNPMQAHVKKIERHLAIDDI